MASTRKRNTARAAREQHRQRAGARKLRYTNDREPGITRRRAGKGFAYWMADGSHLRDPIALARIRALAIPPAYTDVWICADRRGHLQATGRDARGRKQYRYHADWRDARDARKYRRLLRFGEHLPQLRACLRRDLAREGLPREKVLAIMVRVMRATCMRVGSSEYTRDNHSYGLTTLRSRHVTFASNGHMLIHFRGKGGKRHATTVCDHRLATLVRRCEKLPGRALFQYKDGDECHAIDARQFNEYLRDAMGARFSAKDFRTWTGTLSVIGSLASTPLPARGGERARRATMACAIEVAAARLGNTPAVCRKAYVCPRVLEGWCSGDLQRVVPDSAASSPRRLEKCAIAFLRSSLGQTANRAADGLGLRSGSRRTPRKLGTLKVAASTGCR